MEQEPFSPHHPFTHAQVQATVEAVATEAHSKRLFVNVTTAHRENVRKGRLAERVAFIASNLAILAAQIAEPTVSRTLLAAWCIEAIAIQVLRWGLLHLILRLPPASVSTSMSVRLIPLWMARIVFAHWCVTLLIFVDAQFTLTVLVIVVSFLVLGTSSLGFWLSIEELMRKLQSGERQDASYEDLANMMMSVRETLIDRR